MGVFLSNSLVKKTSRISSLRRQIVVPAKSHQEARIHPFVKKVQQLFSLRCYSNFFLYLINFLDYPIVSGYEYIGRRPIAFRLNNLLEIKK